MSKDLLFPAQTLRLKLLGLGIPHDQHGATSLMRLLPVPAGGKPLEEFDIDTLADIVVYLASKKLISIPSVAEANMAWGTHVCQLFRSRSELLDIVVPYLKKGLEEHEYCIWIVSSMTVREARDILAVAVPRFAEYEAQLEVHAYEKWYLNGSGKLRAFEEIMSQWVERERAAIQGGYKGLRVTGDTYGLRDTEWSSFMKYEVAIQAALHEHRIRAICTYPVHQGTLSDLVSTHGAIMMREKDAWRWVSTSDNQVVQAAIGSAGNRSDNGPELAA